MKILSFILGTILGSFYLVLGTRLPKNEDIVKNVVLDNYQSINVLKNDDKQDVFLIVPDEFNKLNDMLNDDMYKANKYANILMPIANNLGNLQYVLIAIVGT